MNSTCILQVEDEANEVFLLQRAFAQAGIANPVQVASDGQMAIDYLNGSGRFADRARFPLPGLVLLDLKLPRRSGREVLEWIRTQPRLNKLIVNPYLSPICWRRQPGVRAGSKVFYHQTYGFLTVSRYRSPAKGLVARA